MNLYFIRISPAGSILQIEPEYFGAISMIAPAGEIFDS
jgi:hypothetical protein